jgi:hypothetical protein
MSKGIDYSKWNHFGESSDDEESPATIIPRVTRLDAPSQVSTSVDGTIHVSCSSSSKRNTSSTKTTTTTSTTTNKTMEDAIQEWTSNGSVVTLQHHEENHTDDEECGITRLYWSQTRETVSIRIEVPAHARARNVQVLLDGAVSVPQQHHHHDDRTTTTSAAVTWTQSRPTLKITTTATATRQEDATSQRMVLLEGTLAYPVYVEEEEGLDWTLESAHEKKYIVVTLDKVTPVAGMTLWWTRPIEGIMEEVVHPQLDRRNGGGSSFPQAWKEAHEQFRENIKKQKREKKKRKRYPFKRRRMR